jgi:ATP-dependent exoDNAse (exonuclease V) alpha subunit
MAKYDRQDPYDLDRLRYDFSDIDDAGWERYIDKAKEHKLGFDSIGALMNARSKGRSHNFSDKQKLWALNLVEKLDQLDADAEKDEKAEVLLSRADFRMPASHVTLRVAWHDNKWNGTICKDPKSNVYCSGFNSLLSERIRSRKEAHMDEELAHAGVHLNDMDYMPPCFWSVNLFGKDPIKVRHDNPAASTLNPIAETLEPRSMFSWPFAISFTRTDLEKSESGSYPKNLESVRVPRFTSKLEEGKSIAFMYAKFSNPLTEEEQQYLVVGAGIVDKRQDAKDIKHFGPKEEIEKIRGRNINGQKKHRNFPSMNWAMQLQFDDYSMVRMPYHEYLEHVAQMDEEFRDAALNKIKVGISEPELTWCFKYVAMDIGDDEAIYILTKMRKALMDCKHDGVVSPEEMQERIEKVEGLLRLAWGKRSYFPGFVSVSRALMNKREAPDFPLERFYEDLKLDSEDVESDLRLALEKPKGSTVSKGYTDELYELQDRLDLNGLSIAQFLELSMLNLNPFQFDRILNGKLRITTDWVRDFDEDVKASHRTTDIIANPYLLHEDYDYWPDSHDDVYGEELDAPIDLFKIDIAYFPDTRFAKRLDMQRTMRFADKRRIRALIIRHLKGLEQRGDCFSTAERLQEASANYPLYYEIGQELKLPSDFFYPMDSEYVNHFQEEPRKLELVEANDTMYFYLREVFDAEKNIEEKVLSLLRKESLSDNYPGLSAYLDKSINDLNELIGSSFDAVVFREEREELYKNLFSKRFFILTGNAGSGKSYEILNIIDHLVKAKGEKYLLLAPTGKASLRLSSEDDFEGIEASTIDKFISGVKYRKITQQEVRSYQNVIIDETSMVDLMKFDQLLRIFNFEEPSFKRLILIGDPNQLPAIGFGRVLADLIEFTKTRSEFKNHFIRLESNCRSELSENKVLELAKGFMQKSDGIEQGILEQVRNEEEDISTGFTIRYWSTKDELYRHIGADFDRLTSDLIGDRNDRMNQVLGLSPSGEIVDEAMDVENFQILSPYHGQYSGASRINDLIQSEFKQGTAGDVQKVYKKADKLIRTKNYYHKQKLLLSNGTLGIITDKKRCEFAIESRDGIETMPFDEIRSSEREFFELAYAITVHKSQGSGFNHLFLVLPARFGLLNRELVYTALTRTKKTITLFLQKTEGQRENILETALKRPSSSARLTSLMLDKPYRFYNLEPEPGVFVSSRVELMIYHILMNKRKQLGSDVFNFDYEVNAEINGETIPIKTDFTINTPHGVWYWEHLGLLDQRSYNKVWKELKTKTYQKFGVWDRVVTTDERNGISMEKIQEIVDLMASGKVATEDKHNQYSEHHFYLR